MCVELYTRCPLKGLSEVTCSSVSRARARPAGSLSHPWYRSLVPFPGTIPENQPWLQDRLALHKSAELPAGLLITTPWCWDLIRAAVINASEKRKPQVRHHLQVALMEGSVLLSTGRMAIKTALNNNLCIKESRKQLGTKLQCFCTHLFAKIVQMMLNKFK